MQTIDNPQTAKDYLKLGNELSKQGKLNRAAKQYLKALQLKPKFVPALNRLAAIYEKQKKYEQALKYRQQALQVQPENTKLQKKLAELEQQQERQEEKASLLNSSQEHKEGAIYSKIWNALNQTSLEKLEEESENWPQEIDIEQAKQYFARTSQYKIIKLNSLTEEDKQFLESAGLSLTYLKQNQARLINKEGVVEENPSTLKELERLKQINPVLKDLAIKGDFQQSLVDEGCIYTICPQTGKVLSSNDSFPFKPESIAVYCYRFISSEIFYLITTPTRNLFAKGAIYFPKRELIVELHSYGSSNLPDAKKINAWKAYVVSCWGKIRSYLLSDSDSETVVVVSWGGYIAHQLWNILSGIHKLWQTGNFHKVDQFLILNSEKQFFGSLEEIFPEVPPEKIQRFESPQKVNEQIWENNYFALLLGDAFIKEDLTNRIYRVSLQKCSPTLKAEIEEAKKNHFPLLWVTIRLGSRTWVNQVEGLANIIKSLSEQFPSLGVVFDGCSRAEIEGKLVVDEKLEATINKEKETVRQIQSLLPPEIKVYDTVGSLMYESIVWAYAIDLSLIHWGGNLVKPVLIAGKPSVIHTNKLAYKKPLSNRWGSWQRENGIVPVYIPEEYIVDVTEEVEKKGKGDKRKTLNNYDCDWRVIYEEVLKLAKSIKRD